MTSLLESPSYKIIDLDQIALNVEKNPSKVRLKINTKKTISSVLVALNLLMYRTFHSK